MLFSTLPSVLCGSLIQAAETDPEVCYLLTDSRRLVITSGSVFFALPGSQQNGHKYLTNAYEQGIRLFIIEAQPTQALPKMPLAGIITVDNTLKALQNLAQWHRKQFNIPVIGITGSNGKTIIKEWLASLLPPTQQVVRSPKSYNSQLGVPLSVWQMEQHHTLGIFEAGISQPGEMDNLASIIRPTLGIFTNLGNAHNAGFSSQKQKLEEKARLFNLASTVVFCADHTLLATNLPTLLPQATLITWSRKQKTDATIYVVENPAETGTHLTLHFPDGSVASFTVPYRHRANLENVTHCLVTLHTLDLLHEGLADQLLKLPQPAMRLEMKQGIHQSIIIDDAYNNDIAGLEVALGFMSQQESNARHRTLILSDLLQTGRSDSQVYKAVAALAKSYRIDRLLAIGPKLQEHSYQFSHIPTVLNWATTEGFLADKPEKLVQNDLILVKGARPFGFERIVRRLEQKVHGTVLEIDLDALAHNLNFYRSRLKPGVKTMVMVKAFAYGSGSQEVARLLQYQKVDYLAVAYTDEGVSLRQAGIRLPIMVMNAAPDTFANLLEYNLEPELYSLSQLQAFTAYLHKHQHSCKAHLKLDTGMHRLGFIPDDIPNIISLLQRTPTLQIASIFSHLAGADSSEFNAFSHQQAAYLGQSYEQLCQKLGIEPIKHLVNSAGILRFPEYHFNMVRLGIGLYGADASGTNQHHLQPISRLLATVSQVKEVPAGDTVGYSRAGQTQRITKVATLSIGYADGYDRRFSNGLGYVLIQGQKAYVLGRVCMDMTMVDVTGLQVEEGDEATIFGADLPITELAENIGTIPYEILTNISERVKRVFYTA